MEIGNKKILEKSLFWDKRITEKKSSSYQLLMHCSQTKFSYCIFHTKKKELLGANAHLINDTNTLQKILEQDIFNWNYESIKINLDSNKSTIVPNSFFEKKIIEKYLYFNEKFNKQEIDFFCDELKYMDATVISSTPKKLTFLLKKKFKKIKIQSHSSVFIDSILRKCAQSKENEIFIDLSANRFDIGVVKQSKLFLYNNFTFLSKNDFLYYILNCYNTLNLDSKKDKLYISGEFETDKIIPDLKEYLYNILLQKRITSLNYSNVFNKMPDFYFHKLFNLIKCV